MTRCLALLFALVLAGCATSPPEPDPRCEAGGGCLTITRQALVQLVERSVRRGAKTCETDL